MDDTYSTGSSIMPQKKNPDVTELVRGKTGRVFGNLIGILTVMKGLPLAYNKDTQEDKEGVFDSIDTIKIVLEIFSPMLKTMTIKKENMKASIYEGFINATDIADYLAKKGLPFREAHKVVGELVSYCEQNNKLLTDSSYEEFKNSHNLFEEDIVKESSIEACINGRKTYGGTALSDVERQIENAKAFLGKN